MNVAPLDKPPDGDRAASDDESSRRRSVTSDVKRAFRRLVRGLESIRDRFDHRDGTADDGDRTPTSRRTSSRDQVRAPRHLVPHRRRDPNPSSSRRYVNEADVVGIETDRGLRITVPENPDAQLTSDVWTEVER